MKKQKYIITLLLIVLGTACSEDFLDKKPLGLLTSENFFETEEQAVWATNAVYNILRSWEVHVFSYIGMTDIISDDADKGSTPNDGNFLLEIENFEHDAGNVATSTVWSGYYRGIYRANLCLLNIPDMDIDPVLRDRLVGENHFLRAYFYFNLVRWFGGVPLIEAPLAPEEYQQPRATEAEVYALIEQDLLAAIEALPLRYPAVDLGRVTRGAAQGLLAKVYLTRGRFADAEKQALDVINSNEYELYPDYTELFQLVGENSSESVFEVQAALFDIGGGGSQYNEVQGVRGTPNLGWGFNRPSNDLIASYESGDPRRDATILYEGEILPDGSAIVQPNPETPNARYNQKAWVPRHPQGNNGDGQGNIRVLRYADVLLMAAEALNENGKPQEALVYLNRVRARARGSNPNLLPDVTETGQEALRQRIWRERRAELALEQQRWFDLLRQDRAAEVMQALGKNFVVGKHELFPIPQTEIDLSGGLMSQNPMY